MDRPWQPAAEQESGIDRAVDADVPVDGGHDRCANRCFDVTSTQRVAGIELIALSVAVFPANLHMAMNPDQFPQFAQWLLYARLPLQLVIIGGIYWCSVSPLSRIRWMFRRPL